MSQKLMNPNVPMPHLRGIGHRWIDTRNARFHVAESTAAGADLPVVVLLHGWPQHWWCWRYLIPDLVPIARVVAIDLRGHGWSSAPATGYLKEEMADDLFAVLDELGHDRVTLVGHDWGGWIGFLAALRAPDRFDALIALGIIHPFQRLSPTALANAWRGSYQVVLAAPFVGRMILRHQPWVLAEMIRLGTYRPDSIDSATRRQYADVLAAPDRARASVQMYRTFLVHELARLGQYRQCRLSVPTRLLVGAADPVADESFLAGWQEHADDMTVELLDEVGHFVPEEAPAPVIRAITALLR